MKRLAIAFSALMLLAGCAHVGPEYKGPVTALSQSPSVRAPFTGVADGPFSSQPVPDRWWRLYNDPQLDALVAQALEANRDLHAALANIARAEALEREAAAQGRPLFDIGGSTGFAKSTGSGTGGHAAYDAGISIAYEVDLVGRLRHLVDAAHADTGAAQAAYDLTRVSVAAGVTSAYADACSAAYQRLAAQRSLDLQMQSLAMTKRLVAGGRGTQLDLTRAQVLVEQLRAPLPDFEAAHRNALFRLAALLGLPPADYPQAAASCARPPHIEEALPVGDGAALIRRRPDIRAAERRLAASTARIGIAVSELYPTIRLGGGLASGGPLSDLGSGSSFGFSLGPLISWSFPNRAVAHAHIDATTAERDAALAQFDATMLDALREVETALSTYGFELRKNLVLHSASDAAAQAVREVHAMHRMGRESALAEIDAERNLAAAQASTSASDAALSDKQVAVFLALGGGWQAD